MTMEEVDKRQITGLNESVVDFLVETNGRYVLLVAMARLSAEAFLL